MLPFLTWPMEILLFLLILFVLVNLVTWLFFFVLFFAKDRDCWTSSGFVTCFTFKIRIWNCFHRGSGKKNMRSMETGQTFALVNMPHKLWMSQGFVVVVVVVCFLGPQPRHKGLGLNQSYSCQPQPQHHQIWTTSVTYTTAHDNAGSLTHWARPEVEPASSWILATMGPLDEPFRCLN